jgi:hypothetical protein
LLLLLDEIAINFEFSFICISSRFTKMRKVNLGGIELKSCDARLNVVLISESPRPKAKSMDAGIAYHIIVICLGALSATIAQK